MAKHTLSLKAEERVKKGTVFVTDSLTAAVALTFLVLLYRLVCWITGMDVEWDVVKPLAVGLFVGFLAGRGYLR